MRIPAGTSVMISGSDAFAVGDQYFTSLKFSSQPPTHQNPHQNQNENWFKIFSSISR